MVKEFKEPKLRFSEYRGTEGWEEVKLGKIGEFKTSSVDKLSKENEKEVNLVNYMDVYKHKDINKTNINELMKVTAKDNQIEGNNLLKGDMLFTPSSETPEDIGHSIVIPEDLPNTLYSYHLMRFRPNIELSLDFANYFCNTPMVRKQIIQAATGLTRFTISIPGFSDVVIKIPKDMKEQQKIGSFFTLLDQKINLQQNKIQNLTLYKKGLLQKVMNQEIRFKDDEGREYPEWEEVKLGDIIFIQGGYAFKSSKYRISGIPVIRISNIDKIVSIDKDIVYYDRIDIDKKFIIEQGDLLVAMSGATTGKTGIYHLNQEGYLNQRVGKFVSKSNNLYYQYLYSLVDSDIFGNQLKTKLVAGAQPNISPSDIEDIVIELPCKEEQQKIASLFSTIDKKIEKEQQKLELLRKQKKGFMQQMFI